MSTIMTTEELDRLAALLSRERLKNLLELTGDRALAVQLHQDTLGLNSHLIKLVATIEIALRNTVYTNISEHFGVDNWLQQPPVKLTLEDGDRNKIHSAVDSAKKSEYAKMSQAEKAVLKAAAFPQGKPKDIKVAKLVKKKRENIQVPDGKIIAELTFAFWKRLYSQNYEYHLWRTTLKRTFPNKRLKRAQVSSQLEIVYQMRNRLAHHEPVIGDRFHKLIAAIEFVQVELSSKSHEARHALQKLLSADLEHATGLHSALESELAPYRSQILKT